MSAPSRIGTLAAFAVFIFSLNASAQERTFNPQAYGALPQAANPPSISATEGVEAVGDGGFEAGSPNPSWTESSTNFGTPLCTIPLCTAGGGSGPASGDWWAWFGGLPSADEEGSVSQDVTFPSGAATLSFELEVPVCQGDPADYLEVLVDGNQEWVLTGDDLFCGVIGYTQQVLDVSAYADGGVHTIEFHGETFANVGGPTNFFVDNVTLVGGEPPAEARFLAVKTFDDGNTGSVEVTLSCNTGLPLEQTANVAPGATINFVVADFAPGTLGCEMTEAVPDGYSPIYDEGDGLSDDNCTWQDLVGGQYVCDITNFLDQVEIEVSKVWIDENPQFNGQNVASANWSCNNVGFGDDDGVLDFFGNPGVDSIFVYPDWQFGTTCSVVEVDLFESGVEVDDNECQGLVVWPGAGTSCAIYNTRLYEGIPTLSQYGLAVLALLMLGVGFVAFRRMI